MKIHFLFVNAAKSGALADLRHTYIDRATALGRQLGVSAIDVLSIKSGGGMEKEAQQLENALSRIKSKLIIGLDETGHAFTSTKFAQRLSQIIETPDIQNLCFIVGGAEGISKKVKPTFDLTISFGQQTWPHQLVHVMVTEQTYRAFSILLGAPYHKV